MVQSYCRGSLRLSFRASFVYINDLVDNISADVRLLVDDTSIFTIVYDESVAADQINRDPKTISDS